MNPLHPQYDFAMEVACLLCPADIGLHVDDIAADLHSSETKVLDALEDLQRRYRITWTRGNRCVTVWLLVKKDKAWEAMRRAAERYYERVYP